MEAAVVRSGCASSCWRGDVLVVSVSGLYGLQTHRDLRARVLREIEAGDPRAIVADLRGAISLLTDGDRGRLVFEAAHAAQPIMLPVAMAVPPPLLRHVREMCANAWAYGLRWVPFVDLEDALDWASRRHPSQFAPFR